MEYLSQLIEAFENKPIAEALRFAAYLFPARVRFSSSLGQEDQVLTDIIARNRVPVSIFTIDTGRLFNEVYDTLDKTTARYKIPIDIYFPQTSDVQTMVAEKGI